MEAEWSKMVTKSNTSLSPQAERPTGARGAGARHEVGRPHDGVQRALGPGRRPPGEPAGEQEAEDGAAQAAHHRHQGAEGESQGLHVGVVGGQRYWANKATMIRGTCRGGVKTSGQRAMCWRGQKEQRSCDLCQTSHGSAYRSKKVQLAESMLVEKLRIWQNKKD